MANAVLPTIYRQLLRFGRQLDTKPLSKALLLAQPALLFDRRSRELIKLPKINGAAGSWIGLTRLGSSTQPASANRAVAPRSWIVRARLDAVEPRCWFSHARLEWSTQPIIIHRAVAARAFIAC